jgi:tetratricopeptide (TPR) repeat protein
MHESLGDALRIKGDLLGAMAEYRAALQLHPDFVNAHISLGTTLYLYGDANGAVSEYQAAIRLAPKDATAHHNLAATLKTRGDEKGAISEYLTASRLDPSNSYTLDRLASLYATASDATLRNPSKSVEYALQAAKLDDAKNPSHLNTLAGACYVNREYKNAVLTEKKALAHAPDDATRKSLEANLAKYELTLGEPSAGKALALPMVPAPVQTRTSERANAARVPYEKGLEAVKQQDWNLAVSNFLWHKKLTRSRPRYCSILARRRRKYWRVRMFLQHRSEHALDNVSKFREVNRKLTSVLLHETGMHRT